MDDQASFHLRAPRTTDEKEFMGLTELQRTAIQTTERVGASLSLVGVVLIFITYAAFKRLRTVPNTFILFASIANVGASIACLIGYAGLTAGDQSPLCQVQAFLLEMFMQSDSWWSLAMAVNVYMVFFFAASPDSFRQYLWLYNLICFGAPALPAFVCLILRKDSRGIYGNATLWCWIDDNWSSLRIFTYYMPIWICILLSALIYFAVGYQVFHQRNQLRNLTLSNPGKEESTSEPRNSSDKPFTTQPGSYGTVVTEVQIRTECSEDIHGSPSSPASSIGPAPSSYPTHHQLGIHPWACPPESDSPESLSSPPPAAAFATVSSISSGAPPRDRDGSAGGKFGRVTGWTKWRTEETLPEEIDEEEGQAQQCTEEGKSTRGGGGGGRGSRNSGSNASSKGGIRWAFRLRRAFRRVSAKLRNLDPVKLAYLRTSFVFAISVLVTWTPSSINRVYTLVYPQRFNFGLNMASAVVLPLQGLWNAIIYCATSWAALRDESADLYDSILRFLGRGRGREGAERLPGSDRWAGARHRRFGSRTGRRVGRNGQEVEMKPRRANVRVFRGGSF